MKRVIIEFPINKQGEIADIIGTEGYVTLLCFTVDGGLFDKKIRMHIAVPNEKSDSAQVKFKNFIQNS